MKANDAEDLATGDGASRANASAARRFPGDWSVRRLSYVILETGSSSSGTLRFITSREYGRGRNVDREVDSARTASSLLVAFAVSE